MDVNLDMKALERLLGAPRGPIGLYLYRKALKIKKLAKSQVGKDTGKLRSSIHIKRGRAGLGQYVEIGSNVNYALLHHEGTKPHVIRPTQGKMLRFSAQGRIVYTRLVRHPGTSPNKYLSDQLYVVK